MKEFNVVGCDTDSILFCKKDQSEFSPEECEELLKDLNSNFPPGIKWDDDGLFSDVIILKTKNYVLKKKGEKPKYKGSAIKASLKEPRLKTFITDIIKEIGIGRYNYTEVYNNYAKEIMNITDISGWVTRKTITDIVLKSPRTNEAKVRDVIAGTDYRESDKIWTFYLPNKELALREDFIGVYCKNTLLKKLYSTAKIFDTVIDVKNTFHDYSLKKNKEKLKVLLEE